MRVTNQIPIATGAEFAAACKDVSTDFSGILPGEAVRTSGHIAVYIGGGLAVDSEITAGCMIWKKLLGLE